MFPNIVGVVGAVGLPTNYFGDGSDGAVTISSDTNLSVTQDAGPVIKNYTSLTIDASRTLTTNNRCKGLVIYVQGDCTINGSITMSARGASATATEDSDLYRAKLGGSSLGSPNTTLFPDETMNGGSRINKYGALQVGGTGGSPSSAGTAGSSNQTGGGGGGGSAPGSVGGGGAAGTAFSGGGGGGGGAYFGNAGGAATANGGTGGSGASASGGQANSGGGGGGAGNGGGNGGTGTSDGVAGSSGASGAGGVIMLIVGGNLTFGASSSISANGSNGGNGGYGTGRGGGGGGGSGGGLVQILYAGTLTDNGVSITANGGAGGAAPTAQGEVPGGAGGAGSIEGPTQVGAA